MLAVAQVDLPIAEVSVFDESIDFRTDVCDRQRLVTENQIALPRALEGLNISVVTEAYPTGTLWSKFFRLDPETGGIVEGDPGLYAEIMDELAARAGFSWRSSYVALSPYQPDNTTWTDLLKWQTDK